jgi:hypothetical protein
VTGGISDGSTSQEPVIDDVRDAVRIVSADFPFYQFGIQPTSNGISLVAVNRAGANEPGVYAVITPDPVEIRQAYALHEFDCRYPA